MFWIRLKEPAIPLVKIAAVRDQYMRFCNQKYSAMAHALKYQSRKRIVGYLLLVIVNCTLYIHDMPDAYLLSFDSTAYKKCIWKENKDKRGKYK